jgi:hypothetical protein
MGDQCRWYAALLWVNPITVVADHMRNVGLCQQGSQPPSFLGDALQKGGHLKGDLQQRQVSFGVPNVGPRFFQAFPWRPWAGSGQAFLLLQFVHLVLQPCGRGTARRDGHLDA